MKIMKRLSSFLALSFAIGSFGCATAKPSTELLSARDAVESAQTGQAAELAPDRVLEAEQALAVAETERRDDGNTFQARTYAYVAERRAQLAMAHAALASAEARREQAEDGYRDELERQRALALGKKGELQQELNKKEEALSDREQALARTEQQLAEEKAAREEVEARLKAAIRSLEEVAAIKEDARGTVITFSGAVLFGSGKSELLPIAQEQLGKVAEAIKQADDKKIIIEGHTDSRGSERYNRDLSEQRANAVRTFLVSRGVDAQRVTAVGMGESRPLADNRSSEGRANNRRVEIVLQDLQN